MNKPITRLASNGATLTLLQGEYQGKGIYHVVIESTVNKSRQLIAYKADSSDQAIDLAESQYLDFVAVSAKRVS